jgi:hypothetical protein
MDVHGTDSCLFTHSVRPIFIQSFSLRLSLNHSVASLSLFFIYFNTHRNGVVVCLSFPVVGFSAGAPRDRGNGGALSAGRRRGGGGLRFPEPEPRADFTGPEAWRRHVRRTRSFKNL